MSFHGATSIYRAQADLAGSQGQPGHLGTNAIVDLPSRSTLNSSGKFDHVLDHFGIHLNQPLITHVTMDFFKRHYRHFMLLYSEAFLVDHFGAQSGGQYWSIALLLTIRATGAQSSVDDAQRHLSGHCYEAAESILLISGLTRPSVTTVQAFSCLAFYEIRRGNASKGWGFSGMCINLAVGPFNLRFSSPRRNVWQASRSA